MITLPRTHKSLVTISHHLLSETKLLLGRATIVWLFVWLACITGCSAADTTELPADSVKWLVNAYTRADDRTWGLVEIEKAEKGRSYVSRGEHDIRAGISIEPTRVTFTGWGFGPESGKLGRFRVVSRWLCYTDDFGEQAALPDRHTVAPIEGSAVKGKNLPDLGMLGMSPEQMERLCGAPTKPMTADEGNKEVTHILYHKGDYNSLCLFYAGRMFKTTFWRSDRTSAAATDKIVWLLQNGTNWREAGSGSYKGADNQVTALRRAVGEEKPPQSDSLEVLDDRLSPKGAAVAARATPVGRYEKSVKDAAGSMWYFKAEQNMGSLGTGTVKVSFTVDSSGRATNIKVVSGDANSALAKMTVSAVKEAELPPVPPAVAEALNGKPFETDCSFTLK